jgi:hypothetical protein
LAGAERFELSTRGFGGNVETAQSVGIKGIAPFFLDAFDARKTPKPIGIKDFPAFL